ncbi:uncharacterized protein LOC132892488 [Neoarius graeffei]|uniref:uncharacterized protein LOC132892488 n=1 Tax=Neoarius graeffei TaxID=443677 RepID=UPI00298D5711|nr:uncharacterized protein LOC132892488 [Neoarius graeffei]
MESSPFTDLVHALATAQQSQHQALVTLRKEQERCFEALVLAQQEDREAFWHLLVSAGSTSAPTAGPSPLTLTKMGLQDDPEAFITLFEQVAEASGWPMEQGMARLLPLLTREAQLAVLRLPADRRLAYTDFRRAVLQCVGRTPEQQCQRFRAVRLEEVGRPFAFGQQLQDACWQWLRADNCDAEGIVDQVVLEQFITCLPTGTAEWVQCHRPASLDRAIELAEDHLAAVPVAGQQTASSLLFSPLLSLSLSPSSCVPSSPHSPTAEVGAGTTPAGPPHPRCPLISPFCVCLSPPQVSEPQNTGEERKPGPVCWRCGEPGHLQQQCTAMEVGAVVRIPDMPGAALDQARAYRIPTDASDRGLGAVLSQEVEGEDSPVLYISRKLSVREGRYSTIEKECLAIKWAVLALRYYLLGHPFTLCLDHAPLQWLHCMKDANARITCWYLALQPFSFKVVHRPGVQMVVADFLSRQGVGSRLQAGRPPDLSRAVGVCGSGGVVKRRSGTGGRSQGR